MNREIKYRAWVLKEEKMIQHRNRAPAVKMFTPDYAYTNKEVIMMQYTGLKDINGTAIYDGDVVRCDSRFGRRALEVFQARTGEWRAEHDRGGQVLAFCCEECEVIGNIYEHPHLVSSK